MNALILVVSIIVLTMVTAGLVTNVVLVHDRRKRAREMVLINHVAELIATYVIAVNDGDTALADQTEAHLADHGVTINDSSEK